MTATDALPTLEESAATGGVLAEIPVDLIDPSDDNPRADMGDTPDDEGSEFDRLIESIREVGVVQPLIVRPGLDGRYRLVAGERRHAAAQRAGLGTVPCVVRVLDEDAALEQTIVENLHRKDLNPVEEASGYRTLAERFGMSQRDIAAKVGRTQPHISHRLGLLQLESAAPWVLADLAQPKPRITVEQATLLATLHAAPERLERLERYVGNGRFDQALRDELVEHRQEKKRAKAVEEATATGATIVDTYRGMDVIGTSVGVKVDLAAHQAEPCSGAVIGQDGGITWICTDRDRHTPDGASNLKASNMTPRPDDDAPGTPAAPASSSGPARPAGAPTHRGASAAPAGEPAPPREPTAEDLERQADRDRLAALAEAQDARWARIREWFVSRAKPSKNDVVHLLAHQLVAVPWFPDTAPMLASWLLPAEEGLDWRTVDEQELHDALTAFVEKGDVQATKFVLAFALTLGEEPIDETVRFQGYQGVPAGKFADDDLVQRHYDFLRDIGWVPTDGERAVLDPASQPDDTPGTGEEPAPDDAVIADPSGCDVGLDEILDALMNLHVAFYAADDLDEQRFVEAAEAVAIADQGHAHRLWRIDVTDCDGDDPTNARLVPWDEDATEGAGVDGPDRDGDASSAGDGADSHDVGPAGPEPTPAPAGEPAVTTTEVAAGDPTDVIEAAWKAYDGAVRSAKEKHPPRPLVEIERLRLAYADAVAAPHSDPARAATEVSEVFHAFRGDLDTNGPIDTVKRGADDIYRFQPYNERLLEIVEEGDALLPADLRAEVLDVDGFSFNTREGCPAGHLFPRLRVEDLIDAYARRVEAG